MKFYWEDMIYQNTKEAINHLKASKRVVYVGTDPSAPYLHPGHSIIFAFLKSLQEEGHKIIFLIGGITGIIGDSAGKSQTRNMLDIEVVKKNTLTIIETIYATLGDNVEIINNEEWLTTLQLPQFLAEYCSKFSVNKILKNTTFAQRLSEDANLSLQEILYPVLQGIDFVTLYKNKNCTVQIGGSDQWANILAGINIKKDLHAITVQLLTNSQGKKLSKSDFDDISIHPNANPWKVWQFFFNLNDISIGMLAKFLRYEEPISKEQRKRIATDFTELHYGKKAAEAAKEQSYQIFQQKNLDYLPLKYAANNLSLCDLLTQIHLTTSKSNARKLIRDGAVKINGVVAIDELAIVALPVKIMINKNGVRVEKK